MRMVLLYNNVSVFLASFLIKLSVETLKPSLGMLKTVETVMDLYGAS